MNQLAENPVGTLLPEQVAELFTLTGPSHYLAIRGTVQNLRPWENKWIYGEMAGYQHTISFRCPPDRAPKAVGEDVVIGGHISTQPHKFSHGINMRIDGEVIGTWSRPTEFETPVVPTRLEHKVSLLDFLRDVEASTTGLLVLGTQRALQDFATSTGVAAFANHYMTSIIEVADEKKCREAIRSAVEQHGPKAFALLRGGADDQLTMRFWSRGDVIQEMLDYGIPVYTAIGHADGFVGLDKYADESFTTPNGFGGALKSAMEGLLRERRMREAKADVDQELETLCGKYEALRIHTERAQQASDSTLKGLRLQRNLVITTLIMAMAILIVRWVTT